MLPRVNPLSGIFGEAWAMYKAHWRHFASIAFLVFVVVAGAGLLLVLVLGWPGRLLASVVGLVGWYWLQGALIEAVADVRDGRADLSVSETFGRVWPRLGSIVVLAILLGLAIGIGLFLLIVPGLILFTIWIAAIPALVLEGRGIGESFGRSRELVRGNGWNVFGVVVLTFLLLVAVWIAISLILLPLDEWLSSLVQQLVGNTVVAPFAVAVWTLVYYRLRDVKEPSAAPEPAPEAAA